MFNAIRRIKEQIEDEILARPGVTGVDIGYKQVGDETTEIPAIIVFVEKKKNEDELEEDQVIPKTFGPFATDVRQEGPYIFTQDAVRYNPLLGGIAGGACTQIPGFGTLGAIVQDNASPPGTVRLGVLSNWHVLVAGTTSTSPLNVAQPPPGLGGTCPPDTIATVARSAITEYVDGAVAFLNTARPAINAIKDIGTIFPPATMPAVVGWPVRKRGARTGLTNGTVESVDASFVLVESDGTYRKFKNQIRIGQSTWPGPSAFMLPGDSGSVLVDSANRRIVGLLFAGTSDGSVAYANPIADVLFALNVSIFAPKPKEKDKEKDEEKGRPPVKESMKESMIEKGRDNQGEQFEASPFFRDVPASEQDEPMSARQVEDSEAQVQHFIERRDRPPVGRDQPNDE
ncbi:hypothetical protein [Arthrobacter sp. ES3-54]|uniref:hypothetical protein n=1 Tax=Arthrobacter sp. ES3-54 TaxID=1502991 RepID=UPI00240711EF|nr:hypothetical protein [Arthrobacter sp. ES3-54]MDF9749195.1 hypothetical protein [Arthrobacter sp. ES3-54]